MVKSQTGKGRTASRARPWWKDPKWIITSSIAAAGVLVALLSLLLPMAINAGSTTAEELRKCQELRGLETTPQKTVEEYPQEQWDQTGQYRKTTFSLCSWPPTRATASDGYSQVVALFARGPGEYEGTSATYVDRVTATCEEVQFTYQQSAQGNFQAYKPFTLKRGTVAYAGDGETRPWVGEWDPTESPYPVPDEIVVLHDGKMALADAKCVGAD